jgi:hypothetical protein
MHIIRIPNAVSIAAHAIENPWSTTTKVLVGAAVVVGIGGVVFFSTRRAAAAKGAAQAFTVSPDCMTITVVDDQAAKGAATAAALAVRPGPDEPAIDAIRQIFAVLLPQCDWANVPPDRSIVHGTVRWTWSQLEASLAGKTVSELRSFVGAGPAFVATPIPRLVDWMLRPLPPAVAKPLLNPWHGVF